MDSDAAPARKPARKLLLAIGVVVFVVALAVTGWMALHLPPEPGALTAKGWILGGPSPVAAGNPRHLYLTTSLPDAADSNATAGELLSPASGAVVGVDGEDVSLGEANTLFAASPGRRWIATVTLTGREDAAGSRIFSRADLADDGPAAP